MDQLEKMHDTHANPTIINNDRYHIEHLQNIKTQKTIEINNDFVNDDDICMGCGEIVIGEHICDRNC
jgi:hypothetical protein